MTTVTTVTTVTTLTTLTTLTCEGYLEQCAGWPASGQHVMGHFDDRHVVVYQAYRPAIGERAARQGCFDEGGGFSFGRMSWVKPNFLWMMYRCGWAQKEGQEVVLAIWIERALFDEILAAAVASSWDRERYATRADWQAAVAHSDVRRQWDPDHGPGGEALERRAIQLGLRGGMLERFARGPAKIEDITPFVREQHQRLRTGGKAELVTPREQPYP